MKTQLLINTNPYLKDAISRKKLIARSVRTSCGVEGIYEKHDACHGVKIPSRGKKKIYQTLST